MLWRGASGARDDRVPGSTYMALTPPAVFSARTCINAAHLRHFIRTVLPATFSSAIWYFAPQLWQLNRIRYAPSGGGVCAQDLTFM